jgi:GMC oxidoreductase
MAEASGSRQVATADGASRREGQPVHAAKSTSWLGKVFALNPAGLNWPHAVLFLDIALVPLVIFWAVGHEEYLLSALFGVLFTILADPGGGYGHRASHTAVFGQTGAGVTALGFGIGGDAWGWLVLAAGAVTLAAGLAIAFGVHRFVAAYLLNIWFIIALAVASGFHHAAQNVSYTLGCPHHQPHLGSGARLGRRIGAVDRGVVVSRDGNREVYTGDIVAVSAGAANSAKILLNSGNDKHPNGLANGSDQVGRNYMFHNCKAIAALCTEKNDTVYQKTLGINDFYFATKDYEYPAGNIQMVGKSNAEAMRGEQPEKTWFAPEWSLTDTAKHSVDWWLTTEDLPVPENRVTTDKDGNVHLTYSPTNAEEADRLYGELKKILNHTGMAAHHVFRKNFYMDMAIPLAGGAHQAGTCRFGTDPATSVLDVNCKAHELDNLYVVDTSFFPSIGAVNPALTAMANALRVGEHLRNRMA